MKCQSTKDHPPEIRLQLHYIFVPVKKDFQILYLPYISYKSGLSTSVMCRHHSIFGFICEINYYVYIHAKYSGKQVNTTNLSHCTWYTCKPVFILWQKLMLSPTLEFLIRFRLAILIRRDPNLISIRPDYGMIPDQVLILMLIRPDQTWFSFRTNVTYKFTLQKIQAI